MARVSPPTGYTSWNQYIEEQANLSADQSIQARRQVKRDIKLGLIAQVDRQSAGIRYRDYNIYTSPGTVSPTIAHPWTASIPGSGNFVLNDGSNLITTTGDILTTV